VAPAPGLQGVVLNGPEFPSHQSRIFTVFGPRESCVCCSDAPCMNSRPTAGNGVGSTLWYISGFMATRFRMNKKEFSKIRSHLGKTQKQMAQLLGISDKAVQSFEQGWRAIPVHIERQSLLLLALKESRVSGNPHCWSVKKCPREMRQSCPAWEFNAGRMCWLINGTICQGRVQKSWSHKMAVCRKCEVFRSMLSLLGPRASTE